jgi:hypothetical protein
MKRQGGFIQNKSRKPFIYSLQGRRKPLRKECSCRGFPTSPFDPSYTMLSHDRKTTLFQGKHTNISRETICPRFLPCLLSSSTFRTLPSRQTVRCTAHTYSCISLYLSAVFQLVQAPLQLLLSLLLWVVSVLLLGPVIYLLVSTPSSSSSSS